MIGYYVHHQGSGHLHRMQAISEHLDHEVVGLSSLPPPPGHRGDWVLLDRDDCAHDPVDVTAHGVLHWAPVRDAGLRRRTAQLLSWIDRAGPEAVVVDVSVEVALAARLAGVPVVVVAMPGERTDRAHRIGYDLADALVAAWPRAVQPRWPAAWLGKTTFVGAISRFDARTPRRRAPRPPGQREVLLLRGTGGDRSPVATEAARAATPGWTWRSAGEDSWMAPDEVWSALCSADVVVTHAGQNALAEVAAARAPAVVVAEPRPFQEQEHTVAALRRLDLGVPLGSWPPESCWPDLLERAAGTDPGRWADWNPGDGASRAARAIASVAR